MSTMGNKIENTNKTPRYNPNRIPLEDRIASILLSMFVLLYGTVGVIVDDIFIPGKRAGQGSHYHGILAWILYASFLFAIANMMSVVFDHYDKRNNENNYKLLASVTKTIGGILFLIAMVLGIFLG